MTAFFHSSRPAICGRLRRRGGMALVAALVLAAGPSGCAARAEAPEAAMVPPHLGEAALAAAGQRYRQMAAAGGWPSVPDGPTMRIGDSGARVAALRARLAAEQYPVAAAADGGGTARFDAGLASAVMTFQRRHGLAIDAAVGPETLRALNVPAGRQAERIALNRSRLAALPPDLGPDYIAINIASQWLQAVAGDEAVHAARVVVGKKSTPTPELSSRIDSIVLNPPWNVPVSIARNEILPRLRRDPGYLARENMIILGRSDDPYGRAIDWRTAPLAAFAARLRQLPGAGNALGRVKFDFANPYGVYLHDTPAKSLFERPRRMFSHGCIRLENPLALALYLLERQGWDAEQIEAALADGETRRVALERPMPLVVLYLTAFVDSAGAVQFRDDAYGWDDAGRSPGAFAGDDAGAAQAGAGCAG